MQALHGFFKSMDLIIPSAMNHLTVLPITSKVTVMGRLLDSRPTDNGRKSHA
jgi:hypothetical protein